MDSAQTVQKIGHNYIPTPHVKLILSDLFLGEAVEGFKICFIIT